MGLKRQAPLGVLLYVLNTPLCDVGITLRIASVAGLKVTVEGGGLKVEGG